MSNGTGSTASTERMDKMVKQVNANVGDEGSVTNPAKVKSRPAVTGMIPMSGDAAGDEYGGHASNVNASTNPESLLYNKYSTTQSAIDREGANIVRHQGYGQDRSTGFDTKGFGANIRKVEGVDTPEFSKKDQRKSKKILKKQERQDKKRTRTVTKDEFKSYKSKETRVKKGGKTKKVKTKFKTKGGNKKGDVTKIVSKNPSPGVYTTKTKQKGEKATTRTYGA